MNSFVVAFFIATVAYAQAGYLQQAPALVAAPVYHAPTLLATPLISAQYPSYTVHSPAISPVIKTLASPIYSTPILQQATYAAPAIHTHGLALGYSTHGHSAYGHSAYGHSAYGLHK